MKRSSLFLLAAVLFVALVGMACKLPSMPDEIIIEISIPMLVPTTPPNGEVVFFEVGEEKYFSDGEHFIILRYDGEGGWWCSDTAFGQVCNNFTSIVGVGDPDNLNAIRLLGEWHEVEAGVIPTAPPPQEGGGNL